MSLSGIFEHGRPGGIILLDNGENASCVGFDELSSGFLKFIGVDVCHIMG
jgi:hypothetical protein